MIIEILSKKNIYIYIYIDIYYKLSFKAEQLFKTCLDGILKDSQTGGVTACFLPVVTLFTQ